MDRRHFKNLDFALIAVVGILVFIGLIMIYSATHANMALNHGDPFSFVKKQAVAVLIGVVAMVLLLFFDYRVSDRLSQFLYGLNIVMLALVLTPLGRSGNGAQSWLFGVQPSEFAKVILIITLGKYLSEKESLSSFYNFIFPFLHVGFPLLVFSFLFIALIYYTIKNLLRWRAIPAEDAFLIGCFLPIFGFFSLTSLTYTALANWPALAYLPAIVFLAGQFHKTWTSRQFKQRILLAVFLGGSFLASLFALTLARYPAFLANNLKINLPNAAVAANNNLFGWDKIAQKIDAILMQQFSDYGNRIPVFCDGSYQTASELEFYLKTPVKVFTTREARHSQFDYLLTEAIGNYQHQAGLLVLSKPLPKNAGFYFGKIAMVRQVSVVRFGRQIRKFDVYYFSKLNASALYKTALHKPLGYPGTYSD